MMCLASPVFKIGWAPTFKDGSRDHHHDHLGVVSDIAYASLELTMIICDKFHIGLRT